MKQSLIKFIIFLCLCLGACSKDKEISPLRNIYYNNIEYGNGQLQTMDVYLPSGRTSTTPVLFLIHGGSWVAGDKKDMADLANYFFSKGFAIVNLNYRLANDSINHQQINSDIDSAINFIHLHYTDYYISPNKFVLFGHSAGAHLALLKAYKNNNSHLIKAVVSLAGPTKLSNPFYSYSNILAGIESYTGSTYNLSPEIYNEHSPLLNVNVNSIPTYIIHGTNDLYVDIQDSRELINKLNLSHVKNRLVELEKNHGDLLYLESSEYDKINEWLKETIK